MRKLIKAFSILLFIALSFSCTDLFDEAKYTSHKITIDENIENGSVTTDTESAIADTEITLIVKPNNGYELESLTVKDADENNVTTTVDAEDSTVYKFKMPASDVTISAAFAYIKSEAAISFAETTLSKTTSDSAFANTLTKTGDGTVTYSSSDTNVAEVDETTGMVTIKGEGTCTITATVQDTETYTYATKTASYTLTVTKATGTISFAKADINKTPGDSDFTNKLTNTGDGAVTYTSSDTSVATVDETTGKVTIKGEGTCTITATVQDTEAYTYATKTATYTLTIKKAAGTISFSTTSINKTRMDPAFTIVVGKTGDGVVTYTSSDASVATVDSKTGKVTIKGTGTCTITATVTDTEAYTYATKTATYTLTIKKAAGTISYTTTKISKTSKDSAFTNALTKTGDGTVTYSSSDINIATVNSTSGLVTIKAKGICLITATVTDSAAYTYATKTASYTLTVAEYVEVETYHEDFTSTRFYYAKDVQWSSVYSSGKGPVSGPKYPYKVDANGTGSQTTASDWPSGSYVLLEKNSGTVKAGKIAGNTNTTKDVPTYTAWICSSSGEKLTKLGHKIIIIGLCDYGFMTINPKKNEISSTDYGTFFYTKSGWTASSNGKSSITVDFNNNGKKYPTYEEITAFINKNN